MSMQPDRELRKLVDGVIDGTLTRSEWARLEERMEADRAAMDYYLEMMGQETMLAEICGADETEPVPQANPRWRPWWAAAAAAMILAAGVFTWQALQKRESGATMDDSPLARLTGGVADDVMGRRIESGAALTGKVLIGKGLAEVTHRSGTRLLIEGPAQYEITGPNAGRLDHGKLVAEVPPGAEGYTVVWRDGKVVDLGTEFAVDVPESDGPAEVGVFRGEVRVHPGARPQSEGAPLYTGHAVRLSGSTTTGLRSIPFDQERFVRRMPTRELSWYHRGDGEAFRWNVSHLVWGAGEYLVVFKWMSGAEALTVEKVELLLDGEVVSVDEHFSSVGDLSSTVGNVYRLKVGPRHWRRGEWELRAWPGAKDGAKTEGIAMFEDATILGTSGEDFQGVWEYVHDGKNYRRAFHPDGTCTLWVDGKASDYFQDARWQVNGGVLRVNFPASQLAEEHLLRDKDSLLFINQPYRNARRAR